MKPVEKNSEGKDVYEIRTIADLVNLYASLPPSGREILKSDIIMMMEKGAAELEKVPEFLRPIAIMSIAKVKWIHDDKGRMSVSIKLGKDDDEPIFIKDL